MAKRTVFSVWGMTGSLVTHSDDRHDEALEIVHEHITAMTAAASRFEPSSELVRINASSEPIELSPLMSRVYEAARYAYDITKGACDPTTLSSLEALGYTDHFSSLANRLTPTTTVHASPGLDHVTFDRATRMLRRPAGVTFDFGATAKALTCDLAARQIGSFSGVCVEIGGDVALGGASPPEGWAIGVAATTTLTGSEPMIAMVNGGVATSSRAVRQWQSNAGPQHHIIDPRTGQSSSSTIVCASVAAADCVTANAFATACVAWGDEVLHDLTQAGWSARLIDTENAIIYVGGWPEDSQ